MMQQEVLRECQEHMACPYLETIVELVELIHLALLCQNVCCQLVRRLL